MVDNKTANSTFTDELKKNHCDEVWRAEDLYSSQKSICYKIPPKSPRNFWTPMNPHVLAECHKTTGAPETSVHIAWTGIVDGNCLHVVWFEGSVNSEVYLKILKEVL